MATRERIQGLERGNGHLNGPPLTASQPPLGDLLRQLADDTGHLVRQEVNLAKAEMRQVGSMLGRDAVKIGIAAGLGLVGALALGAFLIIALGSLIGSYWLSALIVGVLLVGISAILAQRAMADIRERGVKPEATIQTLREDAEWAKREARELKRDLRA